MKVKAETIARLIILIISVVNAVLAWLGKGRIDIADNTIYQLVSIIALIASSLWAYWKNNSYTDAALKADEYMKSLKEDGNTDEQ